MTALNTHPAFITLAEILGGENIRAVGGAVRDCVLGRPFKDIDFCTPLAPDQVQGILDAKGIKVVPTGIDHGTVTAVIEGKGYEITTLRRDVETDGRHAIVAFTDDWAEDAQRRDFTMNTILMDVAGEIYDPLGCGVEDAKAGVVRFVGEADQRIKEDALRILRYFRFYAYYGNGEPDKAALAACRDNADLIKALSKERVTAEVLKILSARTVVNTFKIMFRNNVVKSFSYSNYEDKNLTRIVENQEKLGHVEPFSRLIALCGYDEENLLHAIAQLSLSNAQKSFIKNLMEAFKALNTTEDKAIKLCLYRYGRDVARAWYTMVSDKKDGFKMVETVDIPVFPVTGQMLIEQGYTQGPELGQKLKELESAWIDNDFTLPQ